MAETPGRDRIATTAGSSRRPHNSMNAKTEERPDTAGMQTTTVGTLVTKGYQQTQKCPYQHENEPVVLKRQGHQHSRDASNRCNANKGVNKRKKISTAAGSKQQQKRPQQHDAKYDREVSHSRETSNCRDSRCSWHR
jgi:hypothetical protein